MQFVFFSPLIPEDKSESSSYLKNISMSSRTQLTEYSEDALPVYTPMPWCVHVIILACISTLSYWTLQHVQVAQRNSGCNTPAFICPQHKTRLPISLPWYSYGGNCLDPSNTYWPLLSVQYDKESDYTNWCWNTQMGRMGCIVSNQAKLFGSRKSNIKFLSDSWWFQGLIFTGIWVIGHEVCTDLFRHSPMMLIRFEPVRTWSFLCQ